jgi:nitrilase
VATAKTVKVAAIQATPVILDADATVEKALGLLRHAAGEGAELAVFPETFIPVYPGNGWAGGATDFEGWDELWERLWENSVDVPGPITERFAAACADLGVICALGVNERESERPGSLYNALVLIGPEGVIWKHRKLMPTMQERVFHGVGAGDDLGVADTTAGRIGGLICWENRMPLARYAVYRGGPQIWIAPTADDTEGWIASMRHIAIESGAFVVSVPQYIPRSAFPDDFPVAVPEKHEVFGRGGAAIIEPLAGDVIAGPLYDEEGTVFAECDLRHSLHAKRWFDAVGHYSREDVLLPPPSANGAKTAPAEAELGG